MQASEDCKETVKTCNIFEYSDERFIHKSTREGNDRSIVIDDLNNQEFINNQDSKFDELLKESWNTAMAKSYFWYNLSEVRRKKIEGRVGFIAQLNTKRFSNRRKPEVTKNVKEPFPATKFNFTKIKEHEILFELKKTDSKANENKSLVIINVSPIEYGHVLLVPNVNKCLPQLLEPDGIQMALEMCLLSKNSSLRLGFNSLCAYASVNHLHFHALYINYQLPIDIANVSHISNGLYELEDYVIRGFALQLENRNVKEFSRKLGEIAWYLNEYNIPHNVFISRNNFFESSSQGVKKEESTIRVFIFPKIPVSGEKDILHLNSCCFDVAGYLLLKDAVEFGELTENEVIEILNQQTLRQDEFDELKFNLAIVLSKINESRV